MRAAYSGGAFFSSGGACLAGGVASQAWTVPSSPTALMRLPSGLNVTLRTTWRQHFSTTSDARDPVRKAIRVIVRTDDQSRTRD